MENKSSSITPTEIKVNGNNARSSNEDDEKKDREASARRRKNIVDEICSTERAYVNNLDTLVNIYMNPLKSEGMLTEDQFKVIFCDIKVILQYNNSLVGRIEERVANYDDRATKLGDIFILMADFLKVYTRYVNNYNDAQTVLRSKLEDSKFVQFLHSRKELNKGLDINDYLIMPVQRIPRYNLLLNDLVRNTPSDHPDFADLTKAKSRIEEVATFVNEQKRVVENLAKVSDIIASITGLDIKFKLLSPTRRFLREGEMNQTVIDSTDKTTYYFFLFNDLLVWTKKKKNVSKYVFNRLLYLIDMDVRLGFLEGKPGIGLTLDDKKVVLLGKNEEDTDSWFNDLVSARAIILESESKTVVEKRKTFIHEELLQHHSDSKKETKTIKGFNSFFKSRNNSNERASKDKNMTMVASKDLKAALVSFANTPSPAKPNTPSPTLPAKTTDTSTATSESRVRAATAHMNSLQAPKHNPSSEFPLKNTSPNSSTGSSKPPPPSHPPPPRSILRPLTPTGQSPSGTPPPKTPPPPVVAPVLPPTTTSVTSPELRMKKSHSQTINFTKSQNNLFPKGVRYDGTSVPTTASKSDSKLDTIPKIDKENKDKDKESKPFGSFFSSIKFGGGAKKPDHVISNPVNVSKGTLPIPLLAQIQSHKEHGSTQPNGSNDDLEQQRLRSISSAEAEIATAGQRRRSMTTSN